jgi:sterol desaturase/sphingolipid hydroxylase (fatty acid hydroxylase superfamily)
METWRVAPRHLGLDLLHMASTGLSAELYRTLTLGALLSAAVTLRTWVGGNVWPVEWPLWAQLPLALVVGDLGSYVVHRACHRFPLLWRVHAMHHSSERLHAYAGARNHPLNAVLAHGSQLLAVTILGGSAELLALVSAFTGVHGILQHANVDMRYGPLNWIFATADLHRWHHSTSPRESNTNFGNTLALWDIVFGTRNLPAGRPREVGIDDLEVPENFFAHLVSPFVLRRWAVPDQSLVTAPARARSLPEGWKSPADS